jgi:peptidoglycan/LPS O-acetylase OafA/YrhL
MSECPVPRLFPPLRPESGHLLHLDALRLIASAGIVMLHMAPFLDPGKLSDHIIAATGSFTLFVDMFFVVSGFVIAFVYFARITDAGSYLSFLRKRVARLGPLHWLTLSMFAAIGLAGHFLHVQINHAELYDPRCFAPSLVFLNSIGFCPHFSFNLVSWSISAEMVMYVFVPLLFWIMRRNIAAAGVLAAVAWLALTLLAVTAWYTWSATGGFVRAIPSFAFGAWLFGMRGALSRLPFANWGFWLGLVGFIAGCAIDIAPLALMLTLYATVACGVAADEQQQPSRLVSKLAAGGQLTYSSYLLHPLVIIALLNVCADRLMHAHGWARVAFVLLAFLSVWPVSYLSLVFFERPMRRGLGGSHKKSPHRCGLRC